MIHRILATTLLGAALAVPAAAGAADPDRQAILDEFRAQARKNNPDFSGFSAERGRELFYNRHGGGEPETPRCTSCHTEDPTQAGETRAGKRIGPVAVSVNPDRFTKRKKVYKWFARNCDSVLGRRCTPTEKGDFMTFMLTQ